MKPFEKNMMCWPAMYGYIQPSDWAVGLVEDIKLPIIPQACHVLQHRWDGTLLFHQTISRPGSYIVDVNRSVLKVDYTKMDDFPVCSTIVFGVFHHFPRLQMHWRYKTTIDASMVCCKKKQIRPRSVRLSGKNDPTCKESPKQREERVVRNFTKWHPRLCWLKNLRNIPNFLQLSGHWRGCKSKRRESACQTVCTDKKPRGRDRFLILHHPTHSDYIPNSRYYIETTSCF